MATRRPSDPTSAGCPSSSTRIEHGIVRDRIGRITATGLLAISVTSCEHLGVRLLISVDMEGISGVTRWADVAANGQDYERARGWMTGDVNAAVAGARRAGAREVVVEENHGVELLCNLLLDDIDPDVEVVRGAPRGNFSTLSAIDDSFDALFLVGHHGAAGDHPGICAHTISYGSYKRVRCNGVPISEGEIFATIAAAHGVPTALIASDDVTCARLAKFVPGIEQAVVKRALSMQGGVIVPPARAREIIAAAATRAMERVAGDEIALPVHEAPYEFEIELRHPLTTEQLAVFADRFPEFERRGDRTLAWCDDDMHLCYRRAAAISFICEQPGRIRSY
jgi:D-amino peptidase